MTNLPGKLGFWAQVAFIAAYVGILSTAMYVFQFGLGEMPCPLCITQRMAMMAAAMAALGPFSIDTYLPSFHEIGAPLNASPAEVQQTLSAYLLAFAAMTLWHGALADRFGLSVGFHACSQDDYLAIITGYAQALGLAFETLDALEWSKRRGSRSGRIAWHYVQELAGRAGVMGV